MSKRAIALLEAGRLLEAADAFRHAVEVAPDSAANRVNLAYALQQTGAEDEAASHLQRAVALDAANFDARYMLAGALERRGDYAGAAEQLAKAVELQPGFEEARSQFCRVLAAAGDTDAAKAAIEQALERNPRNAEFHHYRGNLLLGQGDSAQAILSFAEALALRPDYAEVHGNLGLALHARAEYDAAAASFERAFAIAPELSAEMQLRLAATRKAQGRLGMAAELLQRLLDAEPDHAEALNQLGVVLQEQGLLDRAISCYWRAIGLQPDRPGAYGNLGLAFYEQGDVNEAVATYRRGLAVSPLATTHDNLGIALQRQGAVDEAIEQYRLALALDPDNLNTRCNLGAALADGQGPHAAIAAYRDILAVKPEHLVAHSNLLFNLSYDEETTAAGYLAEARRFDAKLARSSLPPPTADVTAGVDRPLRIGFVSGDLRGHPVGYFLEGIIEHLDRRRFELYAYATLPTEDALTDRIKQHFAGWRLIKGESDEAAARAIREDGIDILIDLAGHSGQNRLGVFAWRPALVQLSWLGYFASTGVAAMDYVLADPVCVPPGSERLFTERIWRLPHTRLCYTPLGEHVPAVADLPARQRGHLTFGCFQRLPKVNDKVLALWGRVFEELPTAHLLLQSPQLARPRFVDEILQRLARVGIVRERVTVRPPAHRDAYLATYAEVDVVLDTFPYTGGTTTCEALWMGVPTLTLAGESMLARQGAALLAAAGLHEWVAVDTDDFVRKAAALTAHTTRLAQLRAGLREQVRGSPLFDTRLFARHFQAALLGMWQERVTGPLGESSARVAA